MLREYNVSAKRAEYIESVVEAVVRALGMEDAPLRFYLVSDDVLEGLHGQCFVHGSVIHVQVSGWHLERDMCEGVKTIIHELIHARQFYTGEVKMTDRFVEWRGERLSNQKVIAEKLMPWEEEPYEKEFVMYPDIIDEVGYFDEKHKNVCDAN